jgi:hypothetical protein
VSVATRYFVGLLVDTGNRAHRVADFGDALMARPGKDSAVLGLVQDEPALRAGAASGILDKTCARRSAGDRSAPRNGPLDLTKEWQSGSWVRTDTYEAAVAPRPEAGSTGSVPDVARRGRYKQLIQRFGRCFPGKRLSRP